MPASTASWLRRSDMAEFKTSSSPSPTRSIDDAAAKKPALLIVDDDPLITDTLDFVLGRDFTVYVAESRAQVKSLLQQLEQPPELALIDLGLPPTPHRPDEGFRLINELLALSPDIKILVLSGQNDENNARHARALGAIEFVSKPCEPQRLKQLLLEARTITAAERVAQTAEPGIIGSGPAITKLKQQIRQYADAPFPVLIEGESGSGKELVAASLHRQSARALKPYLALNCAAISPNLVEATVFGHAKGAFTGAVSARAGYFEDARDGTLFLDEIGELAPGLQAKLLRVLQEREFERLGGTKPIKLDIRLIAATNRSLPEAVKAGTFRNDLYYRLNVVTLNMPPLRDRREDISVLADHFVAKASRKSRTRVKPLSPEAVAALMHYDWPGNVRELENALERALVLGSTDSILPDDLPEAVLEAGSTAAAPADKYHGSIKETKKQLILQALQQANGNYIEAAKALGMHPNSLLRLVRTLDLKAVKAGLQAAE